MKAWIVLAVLVGQEKQDEKPFDPAVHEATRVFAFEDFRVIPIRVHLLHSKEEDALDCKLQEKDVRRVFEKMNRIWNKAGLAPAIESIVGEDAVRPEGFDPAVLNAFKNTRPEKSREAGMAHVYYVHRLPRTASTWAARTRSSSRTLPPSAPSREAWTSRYRG